MVKLQLLVSTAVFSLASLASAQTFKRLGTCPTLGCILPPDQQDFLAGQYFDIRLEVHAPVNGSEATDGKPDEAFTLTVGKVGGQAQAAADFFGVAEPALETWDFSWYEDLFAVDAETPSVVNVASKAYRRVALYEPVRKTKNVLLFIGDGMTQNMITAARLLAHKSVNGRYQSLMAMDQFPALGHQMTHSIDSFITDSANSATALYTGHKSSVNALGVYADSSEDPFDDPKVETIAELFHRILGGHTGIVSTAFIADATPGAMTAHTRDRGQYGAVIDGFLHGIVNYTWSEWSEQFCPPSLGGETYMDLNYYNMFTDAGYQLIQNNTRLQDASDSERTLGIFSISNMAKWLDRNVYRKNVRGNEDSPDCSGRDAVDQPGLKEMTLKAIDILQARATADDDAGWLLMSEAASIDKMMHVLDYDRALGELLELDDTIKAAMAHLEEIGELENTQIVVTADHGHGFDVFGSADTKYLNAHKNPRVKRNAIGTYQESGLSQYINTGDLTYGDSNFPSNWDPRYTLAQGLGANPDHRENYQVHKDGPRLPAVNISGFDEDDFFVNPDDAKSGFIVNGTLPTSDDQGVHSLTDVPVFAMGPCQDLFAGVYNSIDIFYHMAECLGLSRTSPPSEQPDNCNKDYGKKYGYHHYTEKKPLYAPPSK